MSGQSKPRRPRSHAFPKFRFRSRSSQQKKRRRGSIVRPKRFTKTHRNIAQPRVAFGLWPKRIEPQARRYNRLLKRRHGLLICSVALVDSGLRSSALAPNACSPPTGTRKRRKPIKQISANSRTVTFILWPWRTFPHTTFCVPVFPASPSASRAS